MPDSLDGLPELIGPYELRGLLGHGGMGRVVAGHDPNLRRDVAIKIVEPKAIAIDELAELRYMFHREARATAALHHPNIVEVYDYSGPDADLMYIACELIDGPTLGTVIEERQAFGAQVVAALGYELSRALEVAHEQSIIHRDLKPDNVFWTRQGRIVLSDFGIAKAFDGSDRLGNTIEFGGTKVYGSPCYMAPEQLRGEATPLSDLYALGVLMYECLSGQLAFDGTDVEMILNAVKSGDHAPIGDLVTVPVKLSRLVESLLEVDPSRRPQSAKEVARRLREILDDLKVTDPRLCLRGFGDVTAQIDAPAAADDDTEIFAAARAGGTYVRNPISPWASLAARGPLLVAMIAMAVGLAAGVHLFGKLSDFAESGPVIPGAPTVSTDLNNKPSIAENRDVFVLLHFRGPTRVFVDGNEIGTWTESVRLAMPPGRHRLEGRSAAGRTAREVVLLKDTQPEFALYEDP